MANVTLNLTYGVEIFKDVTPCSEIFDFEQFAKANGLFFKLDHRKDVEKFGGVGFISFSKYDYQNPPSDLTISSNVTMQVCFYNDLPVFYKIEK